MARELTEQELHNLAMNIVGRQLEAEASSLWVSTVSQKEIHNLFA